MSLMRHSANLSQLADHAPEIPVVDLPLHPVISGNLSSRN
jgi:hypothetical protein